jgi:transcriptional regulator with XRE-family HTH domain
VGSPDRFYEELGARIQNLRRQRGLRQQDLAAALSMARTSIANIEAGRQRLLAHMLLDLAWVLKVDLAELLHGHRPSGAAPISPPPGLTPEEQEWFEDVAQAGLRKARGAGD